jgi:thiol:disulfide interchange protein DsbD
MGFNRTALHGGKLTSIVRKGSLLPFFVLLFLLAPATFAQDPVKWSLESDIKGQSLKSGQKFKAKLKAEIEGAWHLYSTDQPEGGPIPTKITAAEPFAIDGQITTPKPIVRYEPLFELDTRFFEHSAEFEIPLKAPSDANGDDLAIIVRYQVCDDTLCLPPKTVKATFAGAVDVKKATQPQTTEVKKFQPPAPAETSVWAFLWLAITVGALSLLTPCVFPMIPITVSYFTNHSGGSRARAFKLASVYSIGIILTFTLLGMLLAFFVGAAGINLFAANPWVNILIAAVFFFFAFNLFGAYEITVPSSILTRLDSLTRSQQGEGGGVIGALLMGLTFTLTSFTCTSPFVGTILVSTSQGEWQMPLLGMLAFSTVFALPFFILALMPQLVSQLPRSGGWLNSVKVVMGFLEVAAAMKFVSNVDLVWKWGIFNREVVLAIWVVIALALAAYVLGFFRFKLDSPVKKMTSFRLVLAAICVLVCGWLVTGILGKKLGELESFLPPKDPASRLNILGDKNEDLDWINNDFAAALAKAKAENKKVFADFTGYTCVNCRWMEANMFPRADIRAEMSKFVLVRLYTDGEGEIYERQQQFEEQTFGTVALPYYGIFDSDGNPQNAFPGLTRDPNEFINFLRSSQ